MTSTVEKIARIIDPVAWHDGTYNVFSNLEHRRLMAISKAHEIMELINTGDFLCE